MLEKIDLDKKFSKKEYAMIMDELAPELALLQRQCKEAGIPVLILFEGWGAAGKGTMINHLIAPLDPRGFQVYTIQRTSEEEAMRPYMWRFWTKTPAKGRIHILDRSWYKGVVFDAMDQKKPADYSQILNFEEELTADGTVIVKFFLHISKDDQKKRFKKLEESKKTAWRVTEQDWQQNSAYQDYLESFDRMIALTDMEYAPWYIIESTDREYAAAKVISAVIEQMQNALDKKANFQVQRTTERVPEEGSETNSDTAGLKQALKLDVLGNVDLSLSLTKDEYKKKLKDLQERLSDLHFEMYKKRVPVVLAFEGWDAAGKGGNIKRITEKLDPRGYQVNPVAAPNDIEKAHHYLWRFWNAFPKAGHLAIFDRTWYGRVMVERVEGFCGEPEWKRAYKEINDMEKNLTDYGCVVLKFWLNIDKEEQLRRFEDRQNNPDKQWKITEEDWRNREKWDAYVEVVNEMIIKTSTQRAPWIIVEANDKLYARIKVLESVVNALEQKMKELK